MKKKSKRPPSRIKYDQDHPTVSIRVTREFYDELEELRETSGKSLGDILREALNKQAPSAAKARKIGFNEAKQIFSVPYKCSVCGGNLIVDSQKEKDAIARYMRENGWAHGPCLTR